MTIFYYFNVNINSIEWVYSKNPEQAQSKNYYGGNHMETLLLSEFKHISFSTGVEIITEITEKSYMIN